MAGAGASSTPGLAALGEAGPSRAKLPVVVTVLPAVVTVVLEFERVRLRDPFTLLPPGPSDCEDDLGDFGLTSETPAWRPGGVAAASLPRFRMNWGSGAGLVSGVERG